MRPVRQFAGSLLSLSLLSLLIPTLAVAQTVTGRFAGQQRYEAPSNESPVETSRYSVHVVQVANGKSTVKVPVTGGGGLILWTIPLSGDEAVTTSLTAPDGGRLDAMSKSDRIEEAAFPSAELGLDLPATQHHVLHVDHAVAGEYRIEVAASANAAAMVVAAEPDSPLKLMTWTSSLSRQEGAPVTLYARVVDGENGVSDATVEARLATPAGKSASESLQLFDDGLHSDGLAGDGLYAATLTDLSSSDSGFWSVRFDVEGRDGNNVSFARSGSTSFMNERGDVSLMERAVRAEMIGDGPARLLRITAPALARSEGPYRLDVVVAGAADPSGNRTALAWSETTKTLIEGRNTIVADIPAADLPDDVYLDVRLLGLETIGLAGRTTFDLRARD